MQDTQLAELGITLPPTQAELPHSDDEVMETARHRDQMFLLIDSLHSWLAAREDGYAGGDMFVYYSLEQVRNRDFKGPDFFAVLGVPKQERLSWVIWEEGKGPDVVIELLSDSTATYDKTVKKQVYQDHIRVPNYFWFDPFNPNDFAGFALYETQYEPIAPDERGRLMCHALDLALVLWQGTYLGVETTWLRWETPEGQLLPTMGELEAQRADREAQRASQEAERAEQEAQRAAQEAQRAEGAIAQLHQTVRNLRDTGMPMTEIATLTGLSVAQIEAIAP